MERFPPPGELLKALAVPDCSHLDDRCKRVPFQTLEDPCGQATRIRGDSKEHLSDGRDAGAYLYRIHVPDVEKDGTFVHRRTRLSGSRLFGCTCGDTARSPKTRGFTLWATCTVLSGHGDELVQVTRKNLRELALD
jgi:hypothetical protein